MGPPADRPNPITVPPGRVQAGIDPLALRPSRNDLIGRRLEYQRTLLLSGVPRLTPILVTRDGVVVDGHHSLRAAAEEGREVEVLVSELMVIGKPCSILDLEVR